MKAQFKPEHYQPSSEEHRKTIELMRNYKRAEKYRENKQRGENNEKTNKTTSN